MQDELEVKAEEKGDEQQRTKKPSLTSQLLQTADEILEAKPEMKQKPSEKELQKEIAEALPFGCAEMN